LPARRGAGRGCGARVAQGELAGTARRVAAWQGCGAAPQNKWAAARDSGRHGAPAGAASLERNILYTILIADDEASMLEGLSAKVNWTDLSLEPVAFLRDGLEVMEFLDARPVDIILTDIRMPRASGIDVAEYVYSRNLPSRIILLSGYREFDDAQKAMRFGVRRYLTKPFLLSALRDTLREMVAELADGDNRYTEMPEMLDKPERPDKPERAARNQGAAGDAILLACHYIQEHYAEHITLTDVALRVYLNPAYLSRIFGERVGQSFRDYLTDTRIKAAARLLRSTGRHVHEVCRGVGYRDLKHFYRQFKQIMKTTPSEYRRLARKGAAP
jgi:YesN/AraC family two-component response regulator